jgi:hypothetical protein
MITLKERVACRCLAVVQLQEAEEEGEGSVDVEMGVRTSEREHRLAVCGVCVSVIMCAACRASHHTEILQYADAKSKCVCSTLPPPQLSCDYWYMT